MTIPDFLIYGLTDPRTGEVRYIGKSATGMKRPNSHRKPGRLARDHTHKACWIRMLQSQGLTYEIEVLDYVKDRAELNAAEKYWIAEARKHGWRLTNLTDGGDGLSGAVFSNEHKAKISMANKGRSLTHEQRVKFLEAISRRDPKTLDVARATAAWRGAKHTEEAKYKIGAVHRGKTVTAETRKKVSLANSKSVRDVGSGVVYPSVVAAARVLGLECSGISKVAAGHSRLKSFHGRRFEYLA